VFHSKIDVPSSNSSKEPSKHLKNSSAATKKKQKKRKKYDLEPDTASDLKETICKEKVTLIDNNVKSKYDENKTKEEIKAKCDDIGKLEEEMEEGEISSDSEDSRAVKKEGLSPRSVASSCDVLTTSDEDEPVKSPSNMYPPCIRAIVLDAPTSVSCASSFTLKKGFLFIVTYQGGSIGREGSQHAIILPDIKVSRVGTYHDTLNLVLQLIEIQCLIVDFVCRIMLL